MPRKILKIDQKKWCRGKPKATLNNSRGMMCVLGFVANHAGVTKVAMRGLTRITGLNALEQRKVKDVFPWLFNSVGGSSPAASNLMFINDREDLSLPERRVKIREIFTANDWEVQFVR